LRGRCGTVHGVAILPPPPFASHPATRTTVVVVRGVDDNVHSLDVAGRAVEVSPSPPS